MVGPAGNPEGSEPQPAAGAPDPGRRETVSPALDRCPEIELQAQFDRDPVDTARTNQAIGRLIEARSDLTRTLSELSLKLRLVLTERQWQQLQQRRPRPGENLPPPGEGSPQK
jgi:hypothetical protein